MIFGGAAIFAFLLSRGMELLITACILIKMIMLILVSVSILIERKLVSMIFLIETKLTLVSMSILNEMMLILVSMSILKEMMLILVSMSILNEMILMLVSMSILNEVMLMLVSMSSDVVFLCKDGARVHASRLFLVARSAVFRQMLLNGMAESQLSEMSLHEVSSTAFLPVMEFLYTGTLEEHIPVSWQNAFEIIRAAKFFLLEGLDFVVADDLLQAAAEVRADLKATAKFLSTAVEFSNIICEKSVETIVHDLVLSLQWHHASWSLQELVEHLQDLTDTAFLSFLERTKSKNVEPKFVSCIEFVRLKIIILWCVCKDFPLQEPEMVHANQLEIASVLELFDKCLLYPDSKPSPKSATRRSIKASLALSVRQFLPVVDLRRINPHYLVHYIKPLDVIPSSTMMEAFRFHALRHQFTSEDDRGWRTIRKDLAMYRVGRDLSFIKKLTPGVGFALYNFEIDSKCCKNDFEWEIIIDEVCDGFIEIGLLKDLENKIDRCIGESLSGRPGGWAFRMDSRGVSVNRTVKHQSSRGDPTFVPFHKVKDYSHLVYGKDFAQKNSVIKICYHMKQSRCSFVMDNVDFGVAWSRIQRRTLSPAVSLGTGSKGRVRIRILED